MASRKIHVRIDGDTLVVDGATPQASPIALGKIEQVAFFKRDELTTDLICCEIKVSGEHGSETLLFHEELSDWNMVLAFLQRLPRFDEDWRDKVTNPPFATNRFIAYTAKMEPRDDALSQLAHTGREIEPS
jgi:hypothetical protein